MAKLNIVGTGPGAQDYITPIARKSVQQSDLVIGAQRSLDLFKQDIHGETLVLTAKSLNGLLKTAVQSVKDGKAVTLLSTGDPGFSGLLHTVLGSGLIAAEQVNVVAGVSSIQACAARLALSWDRTCLFTFHEGKVTDQDKNHLLSCVKGGKIIMLLPDSRAFPPRKIADFLINGGVSSETSVFVCENLTLPNEKVTRGSLLSISGLDFASLCVMVIKPNGQQTRGS